MNLRGIGPIVTVAVLLGLFVALGPEDRRQFSVDLWLVGVAVWAGVGLARQALGVVPAERDRLRLALRFDSRADEHEPPLPRDLLALEGSLLSGADNPRTFHFRIQNRLRRVVEHRLRINRGIDPETDSVAAAAALGDVAWLIDADLDMSDDGRSPTPAELMTLLDRTELPAPRSDR
ncbi:MAG: hypothetical protein AAFO29_12865 [Actinomycetota bacterium]